MSHIVAVEAAVLLPRPSLSHAAILCLAAEQVFAPRWNEQVLDDLRRLYHETYPGKSSKIIERHISILQEKFDDAMTEPRPHVTAGPFPYEIDDAILHVMQAVENGHATSILTSRPEAFPNALTRSWNIIVQDVDDFMCSQFELHPRQVVAAFDRWILQSRSRGKGPQSWAELIKRLKLEFPQFASRAAKWANSYRYISF